MSLAGKGAWMKGYGNFGDIDDTANASGADYHTYGIAAGIDWPLTSTITAGLAAGYARTDVDPFNGNADVDSYQLAAYAGWQLNNYYINSDITYGHHSIDSDRQVIVGALTATASADYDADQVSMNVEGGKVIPLNNNTSLTPFVGIDYAHLSRDSFTETGAGAANLSVQDQDEDSLRTKIGVRLSHTIETNKQTRITPSIAVAYVREHLDNVSRVQSGFSAAPNNTFLIDGPELDRNRVALNAGVTAALSEHSHLNVAYSGEIAGSDDQHAVSATFRYEW
jgi:outer membrane autotransporter protein